MMQPFKLGIGGSAREVGVKGCVLGADSRLCEVIDDTTMNALFDQEAPRLANGLLPPKTWLQLCHTDKIAVSYTHLTLPTSDLV